MKRKTKNGVKVCHRGHFLVPDNIYPRKDGYAQCRKCMTLADNRYYHRHDSKQARRMQKATA